MPPRRTKPAYEIPASVVDAANDLARAFGETAGKRPGSLRDPAQDGYKPETGHWAAWLDGYDRERAKFEAAQRRVAGEPDPEVQEFRGQFDPPVGGPADVDLGGPAQVKALRKAAPGALPAPPAAGEYLEIPLKEIDDVGNPRKVFKNIEDLAESIKANGILQPLPVWKGADGRYKLVDGGRRLKAAKLAKLTSVPCVIRPALSESDLVIARLAANFDRDDLDPFEKAEAFRDACKPREKGGGGFTQAQLAVRLRISEGQLSNTLRLLELPEAWRPHVVEGRTTVTAVRDGLLKFVVAGIDPQHLVDTEELLKEDEGVEYPMPWTADSLAKAVIDVLHEAGACCVMKPWSTRVNVHQLDEKQRKELQIVEVPGDWSGETNEVALNLPLLKRMEEEIKQAEAAKVEKAEKRAEKKAAKTGEPKKTAAELRAAKERQDEILNKRLYRYKTGWLQREIVNKLPKASIDHVWRLLLHFATQGEAGQRTSDLEQVLGDKGTKSKKRTQGYCSRADILETLTRFKGDVAAVARSAVVLWCTHEFEGYHADFGPLDIETAAELLGIDFQKTWRCDDAFLDLLSTAQLKEVAEEWKIAGRIVPGMNRAGILDTLGDGANGTCKCPKMLAGVKPVSLCH